MQRALSVVEPRLAMYAPNRRGCLRLIGLGLVGPAQ